MKDRSLAKKRPLSRAKAGSSPNGIKQSLKRPIRSFFSKGCLRATPDDIKSQKKPTKQLLQGTPASLVNIMADALVVEDE